MWCPLGQQQVRPLAAVIEHQEHRRPPPAAVLQIDRGAGCEHGLQRLGEHLRTERLREP